MKKTSLFLLICATILNVSARTRHSSQAMAIAENFFISQSRFAPYELQKISPSIREVYRYTSSDVAIPLFYIFNRTDCSGYVIVSGDDNVPEILGYSYQSSFDPDNIPSNVEWWFEQYANVIEEAVSNDFTMALQEDKMKAQSTWGAISPLIQTTWNQDAPYNYLCPKINDSFCPTGCVATMMAQIMKYYEWPAKGVGSNSYQWNGTNLSMDFSTIDFDWANMPNGTPLTTVQKEAVGTLMQACGYAINTDYGVTGSSSYLNRAQDALVKHFQYRAEYISRDNYKGDWDALIYNELANHRPVGYSGESRIYSHAFICDGYDSGGYFHINWGWGGYLDGYFLLSNLNPEDGSGGYNYNHRITYGITPVNIVKIDNVWYTVNAEGAEVIVPFDGKEYEGDFIIPATVNFQGRDYPVVGLNPSVLNYCTNITSLVIEPPVISEINNNQFFNCSKLTKVKLPGSVKRIGRNAFGHAEQLKEVECGDNVEYIDEFAFSYCSKLQEITLPNSLKTIGKNAFVGDNELTKVTFGNNIESIGDYAFEECMNLIEVVLPNSVKFIGSEAFYGLPALKYVRLGGSVESIGRLAFYTYNLPRIDCYALEPPTCDGYPVHLETELHVCQGYGDVYRSDATWGLIANIIDDLDPKLGVDNMVIDTRFEKGTVHSLSGVIIMENATEAEVMKLPAGIYIYDNRKIIIK